MTGTFKGSAGWSGRKPMEQPIKFKRPVASAAGQGPHISLIRVSKHAKAKGPKP